MRSLLALSVVALTTAVTISPPSAHALLTWDFVVTYDISDHSNVIFSLAGSITATLACPGGWIEDTAGGGSALDDRELAIIRGSYLKGILQFEHQKDWGVNVLTLTCPSGAMLGTASNSPYGPSGGEWGGDWFTVWDTGPLVGPLQTRVSQPYRATFHAHNWLLRGYDEVLPPTGDSSLLSDGGISIRTGYLIAGQGPFDVPLQTACDHRCTPERHFDASTSQTTQWSADFRGDVGSFPFPAVGGWSWVVMGCDDNCPH